MFSTIAGFFSSKLFSSTGAILTPLVLLIAVLLLWNIDTVGSFFKIESKADLAKQVGTLTSENANLSSEVTRLNDEVDTLIYSIKLADEIVSTYTEASKETLNKTSDIIKKHEGKVKVITDNDKGTIREDTESEKKETYIVKTPSPLVEEMSSINIETLNEAYEEFFGA